MLTGWEYAKIEGQPMSREGDLVSCPVCHSEGVIVCTGPHLIERFEGRQTALEGDLCRCKCNPPPTLIANQWLKSQQFSADQRMPRPQPSRLHPVLPFQAARPAQSTPACSPNPASRCPWVRPTPERNLNPRTILAPRRCWLRQAPLARSGGSPEPWVAILAPGLYVDSPGPPRSKLGTQRRAAGLLATDYR
ncbi:PAAR domain-containing protein [Pseudomonas sp. PCH446]